MSWMEVEMLVPFNGLNLLICHKILEDWLHGYNCCFILLKLLKHFSLNLLNVMFAYYFLIFCPKICSMQDKYDTFFFIVDLHAVCLISWPCSYYLHCYCIFFLFLVGITFLSLFHNSRSEISTIYMEELWNCCY